jgi:arylsulfatase A-like enzyme
MARTVELYRGVDDPEGEAAPQLARDLRTLYDAEIAANDAAFGELLGDLAAAGIRDGAWIVLTSDHGEEFGEHGRWQHGLTLYEEQLRIPLIVRPPGGTARGGRVAHAVGQVDLLPTLLEAAGAEPPPGIQGRSLLPLVADPHAPFVPSGLFAELSRHPRHRRLEASWSGGYKAIRNLAYDLPRPARELYELASDPGETRDLARRRPVRVEVLLHRLEAWRLAWPGPPRRTATPTPELASRLKALGYLQ